MHEYRSIIQGAPLWVWAIFGYVVWVGLHAMHTRVMPVYQLAVMPFILLALQYKFLLSSDALISLGAIAVSALFSFFLHCTKNIEIMKSIHSIQVPGDYTTFVLLMSFFAVKFYFGYLQDTDPVRAAQYYSAHLLISGAIAGYFIGRSLCYIYRYVTVHSKEIV